MSAKRTPTSRTPGGEPTALESTRARQHRDTGAAPSSDGETPAEQVDGDAKCAEKDPRTAAGFLDEQAREYGHSPRHVSQRAYASADAGELRL